MPRYNSLQFDPRISSHTVSGYVLVCFNTKQRKVKCSWFLDTASLIKSKENYHRLSMRYLSFLVRLAMDEGREEKSPLYPFNS
jgi:hypothetical protein